MPIRALRDKDLTHVAIRVLGLICTYTNRAGITWVGTQQLATDLQVSRQAISKQLVKLKAAGYVQVIQRGYYGKRNDTIRVIFDESIDTDTAIAITSRHEDTRPPAMREKQEKEINNTIDPEGLRRINDMIKGVIKPMNGTAKDYQMPKGDTITVAKMKADIAAKKAIKNKSTDNPQVDTRKSSIDNPTVDTVDNQAVDINAVITKEHLYIKVLDKHKIKGLTKDELLRLTMVELTEEQLDADVAMLLGLYASEGLPVPNSGMLVDSIVQMNMDAARG
jgi:DNA-binding transcriptional regulator YhcF (GntR family)